MAPAIAKGTRARLGSIAAAEGVERHIATDVLEDVLGWVYNVVRDYDFAISADVRGVVEYTRCDDACLASVQSCFRRPRRRG